MRTNAAPGSDEIAEGAPGLSGPELTEVRRNWEQFGKEDPLGAILTRKSGERWELDDFMASGVVHVDLLYGELQKLGLPIGGRLLDFGCGVGRLTQAFARYWDECVGVDVAPSMIEAANRLNRHGEKVRYLVNDDTRIGGLEDSSFDFVYSVIVLQHIPPALSRSYIREFFRLAKPGATVVFQIPDEELPVERLLARSAYKAEIDASVAGELLAGETYKISARVTNRGSDVWEHVPGAEIKLGNHWKRRSGAYAVRDDGRAELLLPIAPGESREVDIKVTVPAEEGSYLLELDLVEEGVTWFSQQGSRPWRSRVKAKPVGDPSGAETSAGSGSGGAAERVKSDGRADANADGGSVPPVMEMHGLSYDEVAGIIEECGATLLHAERDTAAPGWVSYTYYCRL